MDLVGSGGGLLEWRASLLASRGFATLALAHWGYDDLPEPLTVLDLDYFEEAATLLNCHSKVQSGRVGIVGHSKGGELALMLAAHSSHLVQAVVAISPPNLIVVCPVKVKGRLVEQVDDKKRTKETADGDLIMRDRVPPEFKLNVHASSSAYIPVENINCPVLIVCGKEDQALEAEYMAECIYQRMASNGKGSLCTVLSYDGAGHILQSPYQPHQYLVYHNVYKRCMVYGGKMKSHARAEEDFWPKLLHFFSNNLI